jgi:hypothetical protein
MANVRVSLGIHRESKVTKLYSIISTRSDVAMESLHVAGHFTAGRHITTNAHRKYMVEVRRLISTPPDHLQLMLTPLVSASGRHQLANMSFQFRRRTVFGERVFFHKPARLRAQLVYFRALYALPQQLQVFIADIKRTL